MNDVRRLKIPGSRNPAGDRAVLDWVREAYRLSGRFPNSALIRKAKPGHTSNVAMAGGLNQVLEFALGKSPRTEILRAIVFLTAPACDGASAYEIRERLAVEGLTMSPVTIAANLRDMRLDGYVDSTPIGRTIIWSLTEKCS